MTVRSQFSILSRLLLCAVALLSGAALASPARATDVAPATGEPGTWQDHQVDLAYMGFTSTYSCDGLQSKLELLLRQLGARPDFKVSAYGCSRGFGVPDRFARATLKFASLQPADAAATAVVDGRWRTVELAPHRPFDLQDGDCELIEQFGYKVLPLFATRGLDNHTHCVPHQDVGGPFDLKLQVFTSSAATTAAATPASK